MKTTGRGDERGFAIPGTFLNMAACGLLVVAGSAGLCNMPKLAAMASYPSLNAENQDASNLITKDIRRANRLESACENRVVLQCALANGTTLVTYTYNAAERTLTRSDNRSAHTVLADLDAFSFSFFQRPASNAAFNNFAPASAQTARMVGCRWTSSRKVAGAKVDSERVEIAPVVLRNRC